MILLILEANLIWSARLARSARALGHDVQVLASMPSELPAADAAIVNLADPAIEEIVARLKERGVTAIGHAGHKEKDLHALGKEAGCEILATNSEITYKLEALLDQVKMPDR